MTEDEKDNEGLRALASAAQEAPDESFDAAGDFRLNERIPDTEYIVRSRIGRGGHATVYECEDNIGRVVAVKVIQRHLAKRPELLVGMVDEARRHVRLRHPKIVEVYRAGVTSGSRPIAYIEMERLVGGNGRQLLATKKRVQVVHALDILIDVCDALAVAHSKGVVHQDLKPDNIFIHFDEYSSKACTKLLDFGVARIVGQAYNQFEGTLPYAPPEQLSGGQVTPLSDIYALGVVMFEFLTGQRPFVDAEEKDLQEEAQSKGEGGPFFQNLLDAKMEQVAPHVTDVADDVHIPRELEDIIAALLEREPSHRILPRDPNIPANQDVAPTPATAAELAKRLRTMRGLRGLQKTPLTTQELLVGTLKPIGAGAGNAAPAPIAALGATTASLPAPQAPERGPSDGGPRLDRTLPVPAAYRAPVVTPAPLATPPPTSGEPARVNHARTALLDSGARANLERTATLDSAPRPAVPAARIATPTPPSNPTSAVSPSAPPQGAVPAPSLVERGSVQLDQLSRATGAIVGTLDPVIERRAPPPATESGNAGERRHRNARGLAIGGIAVAGALAAFGVLLGTHRLGGRGDGAAASLSSQGTPMSALLAPSVAVAASPGAPSGSPTAPSVAAPTAVPSVPDVAPEPSTSVPAALASAQPEAQVETSGPPETHHHHGHPDGKDASKVRPAPEPMKPASGGSARPAPSEWLDVDKPHAPAAAAVPPTSASKHAPPPPAWIEH